jgi:uncharacterized phage protein (TIGR02218 family)
VSYSAQEISRASGSPVELYNITMGVDAWYFTTADEPISDSGHDYVPFPLSRDAIPISKEDRTTQAQVLLPASHEFPQRYINLTPTDRAFVTIRRYHRYDSGPEVVSLFRGVVSSVKFSENGLLATVGVAPFTDNLGLIVPRFIYSSLCNHVLGDRTCRVDLANGVDATTAKPFTFVGNVSAVSGLTLTVDGIAAAGYPDHFFDSGMVTTAAGDKRCIKRQLGDAVKVLVPLFVGAAIIGQNVTLTAGCDHKIATCQAKFAAVKNFGGFATVPAKNPFTQNIF